MAFKGFAFQARCVGTSFGKEENALITFSIKNRVSYKLCTKPEDVPEGFIPSGSVEWCEKFIPVEKTIPDYYPDFLSKHLFRKVWKTDKWPLGMHVFIKPADRHKRFEGLITTGGYRKKKRGPYWCSEIVTFVNEWRYYIADGRILSGEWYDGDGVNTPDAPDLNIEIPKGYCGALDFGRLTTGELALIEANSPYACGWYGKKSELYAEWVIKGWNYINL